MKSVIHVEVWNCSAMTTLQWNVERNILWLNNPLILFLHVCNTRVSQLNSAEMTFSSFWFSSWGSRTASLSIRSNVIFTVMEEYNSTCFSFSQLSQKTLRLAWSPGGLTPLLREDAVAEKGSYLLGLWCLSLASFQGPLKHCCVRKDPDGITSVKTW